MATDFNKNSIVTSGGMRPSSADTPGDIRGRINLLADIYDIPMPYIGMIVYCLEDDCYYKITKLKPKKVGPVSVPDSLVDKYEKYDLKDIVVNGVETEEISEEELRQLLEINLTNEMYMQMTIDEYEEKEDELLNRIIELEEIVEHQQYLIDSLITRVNNLEKR
jgi:hypothetical protein